MSRVLVSTMMAGKRLSADALRGLQARIAVDQQVRRHQQDRRKHGAVAHLLRIFLDAQSGRDVRELAHLRFIVATHLTEREVGHDLVGQVPFAQLGDDRGVAPIGR